MIASLVPKSSTLCDIGTDHAYVAIYLAKKGIADKIIAADIKKGPLLQARKNIDAFNVGHIVETRLSNGFDQFGQGEAECAIIAGMGGETIINIITEGKDITPDTLILQPMTGADKLRKFLYENGYRITDESFVTEGEKVYCIIKAQKNGENTPYTYPDLFLGQIRPKTEGFEKWKEKIRLQAQKRMLGGVNGEDETLIALCNYER